MRLEPDLDPPIAYIYVPACQYICRHFKSARCFWAKKACHDHGIHVEFANIDWLQINTQNQDKCSGGQNIDRQKSVGICPKRDPWSKAAGTRNPWTKVVGIKKTRGKKTGDKKPKDKADLKPLEINFLGYFRRKYTAFYLNNISS